MTYEEITKTLKGKISSLITADLPKDKVDFLAGIDKDIDELTKAHKSVETENSELRKDYVNIVKNTKFATQSENEPTEEKSLDSIIAEAFKN